MKRKMKRSLATVWLLLSAMALGACAGTGTATNANDAKGHILGIAPITEIFADGWKTTAVVIEYDADIDGASLSASDYRVITDVAGQDITRAYTSTAPEKAAGGIDGPYVILELSHDYIADTATATDTTGLASVVPKGEGVAPDPRKQAGNISWDPSAHLATLVALNQQKGNGKDVYVYQVGDIKTAAGARYTAFENPDEAVANYWCRNRVLDDILKPDYTDGKYGRMKYNIYFPENYDETRSYPAVVFMADKTTAGSRHADVLTNGGVGAVVWAEPAEQAKRECIVIVPAFMGGVVVDENYEAATNSFRGHVSNPYPCLLNMMDWLMQQIPNIDEDRVYLTGQGEGARAAMKMMIDRPYMFAAALLFAPDYDPDEMAKLTEANLWIVTSEADALSAPSMDRCIDALEASGEAVSKATWNGRAGDGELAANVREMIGRRNNINYSVFEAGTLVPDALPDSSANNRSYTWRKGYGIEGLRDWLFTHRLTEDGPVDHVTTITKIYKDGQKPTAVAIEYDKTIRNASLDSGWRGDFRVAMSDPWQAAALENRGIVDISLGVSRVYANTAPEMAAEGVDGNFVIIELTNDFELQIKTAATLNFVPEIGVVQTGEITTTDGETIPANARKVWQSDTVRRLVVDDFQQFYYRDEEIGAGLRYNLYVPENYDETKSYPMVMFIHDASACSKDYLSTLVMCYGASIWATPAEQAKHPCFVLAPQFAGRTRNEDGSLSNEILMTIKLVKSLTETYSIDTGKVYATGQSLGCMSSMAMMIREHDLFAKALLVAGQWDPEESRTLHDKDLWIVVSEGDRGGYPGMNACLAVWEEEGASIYMPKDVPGWKGANSWSAESSAEEFSAYVGDMLAAAGANIKYTPLTEASVIPEGYDTAGASHHMYSMRIAYGIEALRDWLLGD